MSFTFPKREQGERATEPKDDRARLRRIVRIVYMIIVKAPSVLQREIVRVVYHNRASTLLLAALHFSEWVQPTVLKTSGSDLPTIATLYCIFNHEIVNPARNVDYASSQHRRACACDLPRSFASPMMDQICRSFLRRTQDFKLWLASHPFSWSKLLSCVLLPPLGIHL